MTEPRHHLGPAVTPPDGRRRSATRNEAHPDMQTVVIVGNAATHHVGRFVYTPRRAG